MGCQSHVRDAIIGELEWYVRDSLGGLAGVRLDECSADYNNDELRSEMISSMMFWINETDIDGFSVTWLMNYLKLVVASDSLKSLKSDIFLLAEAESLS